MPEVSTAAMQLYLDAFAATIKPDKHVVLVLNRAGWHGLKMLTVPPCMTLVPLPPRSPSSIGPGRCRASAGGAERAEVQGSPRAGLRCGLTVRAYGAGLRVSEVANLKVSDLDSKR